MDKDLGISPETSEPKEVPWPPHLRIESPYKGGVKRVKTDRFYKKEYHDLEVERIWKKCWQMACRAEEIPNVGDYIVYDVAHLSFIVMRAAENEIKAYWNSCPHRGRKLKTFDGQGVSEIRCMFHGFAFNVDGSVKEIPCRWDFRGADNSELTLRQVKTGIWGGWVFINPDPDCEPLADFLGTLPDHYENAGHDHSKRWKQVHVAVVLECNWKVAQEAFMEGWHVTTTHPQWALTGDPQRLVNRWDVFGNWWRWAPALPTDKTPRKPGDWGSFTDDPQLAFDTYFDRINPDEPPIQTIHSFEEAGKVQNDMLRDHYRQAVGADWADALHTYELSCADITNVFPNFAPWGTLSRIVYRYRPYGDDPDRCIMEVMLVTEWPQGVERPPPAKIHWLKPGETTADSPELAQLARVFLQDVSNMHALQLGIKTNANGYVIYSEHNETPIRVLHDLYEKWMGLEDGE